MDFETKLAAMRPDYLRRTQKRVARVLESLDACPDECAARLDDARLVLHDVAGTAPVMGIHDVGMKARDAEDRAVALTQSAEPLTDDAVAALRQDIATLLDRVVAQLGSV